MLKMNFRRMVDIGKKLIRNASALSSSFRHLFAIANAAYSKMMDAKQNQVIIIR